MKILLLGQDGQVGGALLAALSPLADVTAWGREDADLSDIPALRQTLDGQRHDVIINAAAYTAVDKAEAEPDLTRRINAEAVGVLAAHAAKTDALLVHYSTDYVFDGTKPKPYTEADESRPLCVYGRTKREGEEAILASGCRAWVFRTSWVFSVHGGNFIKTILRLAAERESLNVVADQHGAPTSSDLIADVTLLALKKANLASGIYHLAAAGYTSWHGLARFVVERAQALGWELKLDPAAIMPISTEHYPLPAMRPKNSRLDTHLLAQALPYDFPDWKIGVACVIDALNKARQTP